MEANVAYASAGELAGEARAVLRLSRLALRLLLRRAARVWGRVAGAHRNVEALLQRVQELQLDLETLAFALELARLLLQMTLRVGVGAASAVRRLVVGCRAAHRKGSFSACGIGAGNVNAI